MTIEIGHIRWSQAAHVIRSFEEHRDEQSLERPLKHSRVDGAALSSVHVCNGSAASQSELLKIGRIIVNHLLPMEGVVANALHIKGDKELDMISFSFSDFDRDAASEAYVPLPSTITIDGIPLRIFREARVAFSPRGENDDALGSCRPSIQSATRPTLASARILVVGAGGIGCELLKSIVLAGARSITVVDLDTIDATNLNRQFLFRERHIDAPKSHVAVDIIRERIASPSNASSAAPHHMAALCVNVKDASPMDHSFYTQFDIVLNGLDNMSARKHVNRMCVAANIPLIESGTMGFNGQVQPIVPHASECYDCRTRPSDRPSYAVCTIHARPTSMVHCVHYAKELYERLATAAAAVRMPADGDAAAVRQHQLSEMDFAKVFVEDALKLDVYPNDTSRVALNLFQLLFATKIEQLLTLKKDTLWPTAPPLVLELPNWTHYSDIDAATLETQLLVADGRVPTQRENATLFLRAVQLLLTRWNLSHGMSSELPTTFDKQDDVAALFVATVANLRATCFHIPNQGLEDIRSVAGHIVPAIASSNAIVAACIASQALSLLFSKETNMEERLRTLRFVFLRKMPLTRRAATTSKHNSLRPNANRHYLLLHTNPLDQRNPECLVCKSDTAAVVHQIVLNTDLYTIGSFIDIVLCGYYAMSSPCLAAGPKVLYEHEEFETLAHKPLADFCTMPLSGNGTAAPTASLTASDLNQNLEWTLSLTHDDRFNDPAGYMVNGTLYGPSEAISVENAAPELS
jgi:ubiquitin-like 1-activating enzyme E1 B